MRDGGRGEKASYGLCGISKDTGNTEVTFAFRGRDDRTLYTTGYLTGGSNTSKQCGVLQEH